MLVKYDYTRNNANNIHKHIYKIQVLWTICEWPSISKFHAIFQTQTP